MKNFISGVFLLSILSLSLLSCNNQNKRVTRPSGDVPFDGTTLNDISYGSNVDYVGVVQDLKLDVYIPATTQASQKFPLVLYIHAGGFISGDKDGTSNFCKIVSNNGFVSASINYRLGWNRTEGGGDPCEGDSIQQKYALYRAVQDARASLRFLVKNADKYGIDTNWIFITGASAGAGTALFTTYLTQDSANYFVPGIEDSLGSLDHSSNDINSSYTIKGIGDFWGALISPYLITPENAVPTIYTHGKLDPVAPFDSAHLYGCENMVFVYGSYSLYNRTKGLGVPAVMHEDPTGGHGVFDDNFNASNMTCFFESIINKQGQNGYYTGRVSNCK